METHWSGDLWAYETNKTNLQLQTNVKVDLATQATISIVLGLSAFLTFCVSHIIDLSHRDILIVGLIVPQAAVDCPLCGSEEAEEFCLGSPGIARQSLRMDSSTVQDNGRGGPCISWTRCLRGSFSSAQSIWVSRNQLTA